jgi:hypothetical protein
MFSDTYRFISSGLPVPVYSGGTYGIYLGEPSKLKPHYALELIEQRISPLELGSSAIEDRYCCYIYAKSEQQLQAMQNLILQRLEQRSFSGVVSGIYSVEEPIYARRLPKTNDEVWQSSVYFVIKGVMNE